MAADLPTDNRVKPRQVLREFIKLYEKNACLWDTRLDDFSDKNKRYEAYDELIKKYKELQEDAGILDVKRKIENLRSAYRREHKKVLMSMKNGQAIHKPLLWYYENMTFLNEVYPINNRGNSSTLHDNSIGQVYQIEMENEPEDSNETSAVIKVERTDDVLLLPRLQAQKRKLSDSNETIPTIYLRQPQEDDDDIDYGDDGEENLLEDRTSKLANIGNTASKSFGTTVGLQLNELDPLQKMIAEKLISDVIFNARLQKLTVSTYIHIPRE